MAISAQSVSLARLQFAVVVGVALLFVVVAVVVRRGEKAVDRYVNDIVGNAMPSVRELAAARTMLHRFDVDADRCVLRSCPDRASLERDMDAIGDSMHAYEALPAFAAEVPLQREASAALDALRAQAAALVGVLARGDSRAEDEALSAALSRSMRFDADLQQLIDLNAGAASGLATRIEATRATVERREIVLGGATVALALAAAALAAVALRRSMRSLEDANRAANERVTHLERRSVELDQFAGRVAHDVLGPLSSPVLALQVARARYPDDSRLQQVVGRGLAGLDRCKHLVEGLLEFARAGAKPPRGDASSLREILGDVVLGARPEAQDVGVEVRLEPFDDVDVACSHGVLVSMLSNLIRNAVKHMGDARVREVVARVRADGPRVRIDVDDTGPGVPEGMEEAIFEPFVRGDTTASGVGLGLATVRRLARAHGGDCGYERLTRLGAAAGSRFWIELPIAPESSRRATAPAASPRVTPCSPS